SRTSGCLERLLKPGTLVFRKLDERWPQHAPGDVARAPGDGLLQRRDQGKALEDAAEDVDLALALLRALAEGADERPGIDVGARSDGTRASLAQVREQEPFGAHEHLETGERAQ